MKTRGDATMGVLIDQDVLACENAESSIDSIDVLDKSISDVCGLTKDCVTSEDSSMKSDILEIVLDKPSDLESNQCDDGPSYEKLNKHRSDIFFLEDQRKQEDASPPKDDLQPTYRKINKMRDHNSSIFPAGCMGCREDPPSDHVTSPRRFLDANEAKDYVGHIDNAPKKRPPTAKSSNLRNPLTGVGMAETEVKKSNGRRKDGNPLLGEGYDTNEVTTPATTRVPPGGYSQGLW